MPIVKMSEFELDRVNSFVTSSALHTHRVRRGHLIADPSKDYIRKEASDFKMAQRELLAQEFFRLIIPEQPETRLLIDIKDGVEEYYLLSEEIKDWQELPLDSRQSFADGTFTGLGQVLLTAVFLQETDLKNGNIGLGPQRDDGSWPVRKIDGDWCFSEMRAPSRSYAFDTKTIQRLPQLTKDYQPC